MQFEEVERPLLGSPVVAVMQTAEPRGRNDAADALGRNPILRRFLPESQMRAVLMVVADVFREQPLQMPRGAAAGGDVSERRVAGEGRDSRIAERGASGRAEQARRTGTETG